MDPAPIDGSKKVEESMLLAMTTRCAARWPLASSPCARWVNYSRPCSSTLWRCSCPLDEGPAAHRSTPGWRSRAVRADGKPRTTIRAREQSAFVEGKGG